MDFPEKGREKWELNYWTQSMVLDYAIQKMCLHGWRSTDLRQPHRCMRFRGYFEEYLSAAPIHHVGVSRFQTTWTSEVEREALRRAYNANRHRDNSLKTRRSLWPLGSGSCYAPFGSKEMREGHTRQISFCLMDYMDFRCHQSEIGLCHFAILWQIFR